MAHNLAFVNGKASMMYYGDAPWHEFGTKLDHPATAQEAMEAAQLNFTVEKFPLMSTTNGRMGLLKVPDWYSTIRTDTWDVLGVVGSDYTIVQNSDAFTFFDSLVGEGEAIYHTAGALGHGERIWILAKMPDYIRVNGNDIVDKYLLLTTGHNGRYKIRAKLTPIRVVCENTLNAALPERGQAAASDEIAIVHTANAKDRLAEAHKILGLANTLYSQLGEIFQRMSLRKITDEELLNYVKKLVPDNPDSDNNKRRELQRSAILDLHENGKGAEMARGTLWGVYNAVAEYTDHIATDGKGDDQVINYVLYGAGKELKEEAFEEALVLLNN